MKKLLIEEIAELAYRKSKRGDEQVFLDMIAFGNRLAALGYDETIRIFRRETEIMRSWVLEAPTEETLIIVQNLGIAVLVCSAILPFDTSMDFWTLFEDISEAFPYQIVDTDLYDPEKIMGGTPILPALGGGEC